MAQPLPPDAEAIAVSYLGSVTAVTAVFGPRIGTGLNPLVDAETLPALSLELVSTTPATHRRLTGYLIQFSAYAASRTAAFDAIAPVDAALLDEEAIVGVYTGLGVVTGIDDVAGPRPIPDPDTGIDRYIKEVRIYARSE